MQTKPRWARAGLLAVAFGCCTGIQALPIGSRVISVSGNLAFGYVPVGLMTTQMLTITNTGPSTITVTNITYPTGFSGAWTGTIATASATIVPVVCTALATI